MATTMTSGATERAERRGRLALAVADANWFTTENLFREIRRDDVATLLLNCMDFRVAWMKRRPLRTWRSSLKDRGPGLWQHDFVLPTGWMKSYPRLGMRPIARAVRRWREEHVADGRLALVMTYPYYLHLRDFIRPDRHVYFNIDDYALYWPRQAEQVRELERRAVREADLTVCVSRARADELRAAVPEASGRIRHLPHGSPSSSQAEHAWERPAPPPADIASLPRPILGYIGSLEDRLDWPLMARLADAMPEASIVLIGREPPAGDDAWIAEYRRCLERSNVHALGWRSQDEIHHYNRSFDVCLIPYKVDHPFNLACCPTKIMDYMATGRPVVATDLPECRLYEHLFDVTPADDAFVRSVRAIVAAGSDDGRASQRFDWARANTCRNVADRLIDWLSD